MELAGCQRAQPLASSLSWEPSSIDSKNRSDYPGAAPCVATYTA
jgi:hypothetical protein